MEVLELRHRYRDINAAMVPAVVVKSVAKIRPIFAGDMAICTNINCNKSLTPKGDLINPRESMFPACQVLLECQQREQESWDSHDRILSGCR